MEHNDEQQKNLAPVKVYGQRQYGAGFGLGFIIGATIGGFLCALIF